MGAMCLYVGVSFVGEEMLRTGIECISGGSPGDFTVVVLQVR